MYFHHRIFGGENIFKYIFTTIFLGEKIYFNSFSPPFFGGENIFKFIFTTVFLGEKIYLNLFFPDHYRKRENIFQATAGCLAHFPIGMGSYRYININSEMTLGTEIGETSYNMLTIYPIQSNHCGKGLLMMNTLWPHSRIV